MGVPSVENAMQLIYASSNGDRWFLAREHESGRAFVRHVPNAASGGVSSRIDLDAFLSKDKGSPERQSLLKMIGTLVPEESNADRT
jgi:hypothetical protein